MVGLVDAGGVHKNNLRLVVGKDAPQTVAGGLRRGGGNCHLLPHQGVHQGRFAHVGPPHNAHKARFEPLRRRGDGAKTQRVKGIEGVGSHRSRYYRNSIIEQSSWQALSSIVADP